MALLVFKSTFSQADVWWIVCVFFENTGKCYICYLTVLEFRFSASIIVLHITCNVIYIFVDYCCEQCECAAALEEFTGVKFSFSFHLIPVCQPHRKQTLDNWLSVIRINIIMYDEQCGCCVKPNKHLLSLCTVYRCALFPSCSLGYTLLPGMIPNSLWLDYMECMISSFPNFEITPAASITSHTHFRFELENQTLDILWFAIVICALWIGLLYSSHWRNSHLPAYQQPAMYIRISGMLFLCLAGYYYFCLFIYFCLLKNVAHCMGMAGRMAYSVFFSGADEPTTEFLFVAFSFSLPRLSIWWFSIT